MTGEPATALRMRGLTKYYGKQRGIEDLDLDVQAGEVVGFLGPNGAGKTTTIRVLLNLIRPTRGSAVALGFDVAAQGERVRAQTGYLPGDFALYPRMQGEDYLGFVARMRGGVPEPDYRGLADRLGLDLARRIGDLSKGNRQKLGVVQAFMHRPRLLVLDEPTSGLDPVVQQEFQAIVREACAGGATVFLSSHVLAEVQEMADRVAIVTDGRLALVDSVGGLRARATRTVTLEFAVAPPPGLERGPGVQGVTVTGRTAECTVTGPIGPLLKAVVDEGLQDVHLREPDLEDAFLGLVEQGGRP